MFTLFAAFGDPRAAGWIRESAGWFGLPAANAVPWHDSEAAVALAVVPSPGEPCPTVHEARGLVAVVAGGVEGAKSPSATLVSAYEAAGARGLAALRGEYAYALWDARQRTLLLGCDAIGLRAPAYVSHGGSFAACSSAALLLRHPGVLPLWDGAYVAHALGGLWSREASATAFRGIQRLRGGEGLRVSARGVERFDGDRLALRSPFRGGVRDTVRALGEAVDRSVAKSDVEPSCVALSGGLDSCVVATALARRTARFDAFSLTGPAGVPGLTPTLPGVVGALPGVRHHEVPVAGDELEAASHPPADDPVCAGPVMQPLRRRLFKGIARAGFALVFDGEGGDELFDLLWRPGQLVREGAIVSLVAGLVPRGARRRFLRDVLWGRTGPLSRVALDRALRRARASRPWLRATFWLSASFEEALAETLAFARLTSARERLPEILGAYARYARVQELARREAGVRGASPLLGREVVELVGALPAHIALDLRHRKALLRRLAAERVPSAVAWHPKTEPLGDWLIQRWIADDENLRRLSDHVRASPLLSACVDTEALRSAAAEARGLRRPSALAAALVELGHLAQWVGAVERAAPAGITSPPL